MPIAASNTAKRGFGKTYEAILIRISNARRDHTASNPPEARMESGAVKCRRRRSPNQQIESDKPGNVLIGLRRGRGWWAFLKPSSNTQKRFFFQNSPTYPGPMHTPAHWLILADDARNLADQLHDPEAKQTMLAIAWGYDKLARHAALFADTYLSVKDGEAKSD
jgi:hypothetical protein